ncbi:hypothetical protein C1H46_030574 [Malus baccata]|uniref:Uncharacterized protein n=1 Tax=Malus baccata TaxID=106549 RepID=A0A540LBL6_MALBA|nr:hypothetical protein C1H46_030574 [Malus baccata]
MISFRKCSFSIILKGCDDDAVEDCAEIRKTKKKAWASGLALGYFYMVSTCRARSFWGIYRFHLIFSTSDPLFLTNLSADVSTTSAACPSSP